MRYPLVPAPALTGRRLDLESFARATRLHPELVRRLVVLGLLEPERDRAGRLWFPPSQLVLAARIQRLRSGLALNHAGIGLAVDLRDRIAELERQFRAPGGGLWT